MSLSKMDIRSFFKAKDKQSQSNSEAVCSTGDRDPPATAAVSAGCGHANPGSPAATCRPVRSDERGERCSHAAHGSQRSGVNAAGAASPTYTDLGEKDSGRETETFVFRRQL
ncbi:hypothetical protein ABVT39_022413 [Epinephelus coioides]